MNDLLRAREAWPELIGVVAAGSIGVVVATNGFPLALHGAFIDMAVRRPMPPGVYAAALLAVAIAVPALSPRLPGWPVAATGLAVFIVSDLALPERLEVLLALRGGTSSELVITLAGAVGLGLALGGALLALAQSSPPVAWLVGAGLVGGLVVHWLSAQLIRLALDVRPEARMPSRESGPWDPVDVQHWLALAMVVAAAVAVASRRRPDGPAVTGRLRPGVPLVVAAGAALLLAGLVTKTWVIQEFRLGPDAAYDVLGDARRAQGVLSFAQLSSLVLAVAVALLLARHGYRVGGVVAARWVLLCGVAAPALVVILPNPGMRSISAAGSVLLLGLLAVAGGALAARYAPRLLPWDAVGLLIVAAATVFSWRPDDGRSADSLGSVLVTVGLGVALGAGVVLVVGRAAEPAVDSAAATVDEPAAGAARAAERAGVLVLGPATAMLCATALAPVVLRFQIGTLAGEGRSAVVPLYLATGAVLLVLLFGFARAVERGLHQPVEETAASS